MRVTATVHGLALVALAACADEPLVSTVIPVASLHMTAAAESLYVADTLQLSLAVRAPDGSALSGRLVTWTSSAPGVIAVSADGVVHVIGPGSAWIGAASEGVRDSLRLKGLHRVARLVLSPDSASLPQGFGLQFAAVLLDASNVPITGRRVTWQTTAPLVVQVGSGGVFGRAVGQAGVIATAEGRADTAQIRVTARVVSVSLTPSSVTIPLGDSVQLTAVPRDTLGAALPGVPVVFSGTFPTVGTVDSTGLLRSYGAGQATVAATTPNGVVGIAAVTIDGVDITSARVGSGFYFGCGMGVPYDVCWSSYNDVGQVGNPSVPRLLSNPPWLQGLYRIALPARIQYMGRLSSHVCVVTVGDAAWCWGSNSDGQLGSVTAPCGAASTPCSGTPLLVPGGTAFATISAGERFTCGVSTTGAAWCWGLNANGQLGIGSTSVVTGPQPVAGGHTFLSIEASTLHSCGIAADSTAWCWGVNTYGQLGDGTAVNQMSPVAVSGGLHFASISTGTSHTCALTAMGVTYCWGNNNASQLASAGAGTCASGTTCSNVPRLVAGGLAFLQVSAGLDQSCGITSTYKLYCWGFAQAFEGGNRAVPTAIAGSQSFTGVNLMGGNASAMGTDGLAYHWQIANGGGLNPIYYQR